MEIQFSTQDEKYHTELWRPVAKHYAFSSVLCLEPHLDHVIRILQRKLEEGYCFGKNTGAVCNIYNWLSFAAWEVVMMANFSQMQGYLEKGEDTDNSFEDSIEASNTFGYWGHLPWLERTRRFFSSRPVFIGALQFSLKQIAERRQLGDTYTPTVADFLDKFFETQRSCPNDFTNDRVLAQLIGNVAAGGDTTTATMSGIMYNTLKHPHVLKRLQQELDDSVQTTPVSWKVASSLPYFDAVIQESIRLHPGTSFALERIVPRQGLQLPDGRYIESGTIVGMHGWVVNRDKSVFGPNADAFVPERWLQEENEDTQAFTKRISTMKNATLSFGAGKRSCIGKHLAILEIYKIIGTLFKEFDFEFANIKGKEPRLVHSTFVRMEDFNVRLRVRERSPVIV
ncbi:MAG: hypothetical protein LQ343_006650 [Gyalolechia ehrenbergii]|nr:MAG: hypothetical protein LQ343_006650 [Gyalolechia ehrenbergii]